jgi:hypothetical protein
LCFCSHRIVPLSLLTTRFRLFAPAFARAFACAFARAFARNIVTTFAPASAAASAAAFACAFARAFARAIATTFAPAIATTFAPAIATASARDIATTFAHAPEFPGFEGVYAVTTFAVVIGSGSRIHNRSSGVYSGLSSRTPDASFMQSSIRTLFRFRSVYRYGILDGKRYKFVVTVLYVYCDWCLDAILPPLPFVIRGLVLTLGNLADGKDQKNLGASYFDGRGWHCLEWVIAIAIASAGTFLCVCLGSCSQIMREHPLPYGTCHLNCELYR